MIHEDRPSRFSRPIALGIGALLLCAATLYSQVVSGTITGTIRDASGGSVPAADVTLVNLGTQNIRKASIDAGGSYTFVELPPGHYRVSASHAGFKSGVAQDVELQIDQTARVDIPLQVGNVTETVNVEATAAVLQTDTATMGQVIGTEQAVDLPLNGRNFL